MANRKQFLGVYELDEDVMRLLKEATNRPVPNGRVERAAN